ncbi:MAG: DUF3108 domain-containing protein [Candidatus Omnitrophota bacterium]
MTRAKKYIFILCLIGFIGVAHFSAAARAEGGTTNFNREKIVIEPARKALRVGEKLFYDVLWNGIYVGEGTLEVKEIVTVRGREAYHIVATARSNEFLSKFYRLEDEIHSYIDTKDLSSLRFEKTQYEGKHHSDEITDFDQQEHRGHFESRLSHSKKEFDIPPRVQDLASVFYYFRTLDVVENSKVTIDVNADERNWKVDMNVLGTEYLPIRRKGIHKVFCVAPKAPFKGVISKRGKVWVYFSADAERIPLFIKIRIPFGFVVGVLERRE